jgi:glycosyltransferase involved in cell wall biosynthesis
MKPTVWTLHDPWAITGHCVHPYDCARWEYGCGGCPYLETIFAMKKDRTHLMWTIKKYLYHASKIDIIVASKFMYDMAKRSPLLSKFRIHQIPFGLDLEIFRPADSEYAKRKLGIIPGSLVICFRSTNFEFKGLKYIKECLHKLHTDRPVCLLTFNETGQIEELRDKYQIIEMGWVGDNKALAEVYNAADIFLMPSTQEAFGMTAMEAMACGKPVIVFDGTALPETVFAPEGGVAVPQGDVEALLFELEQLINNSEKRLQLGRNALELARRNYNFNDHADKVLELYKEVIVRRGKSYS